MVKAKCTNCKYEWKTNSTMLRVSCPSCGNKVKIRELFTTGKTTKKVDIKFAEEKEGESQ